MLSTPLLYFEKPSEFGCEAIFRMTAITHDEKSKADTILRIDGSQA
jgi:hypothetical protein